MSEKPDESVGDRLKEMSDALGRVTAILTGLKVDLTSPVSPAELKALRLAETDEQREHAIAAARAAGRERLKQQLVEAELIRTEIDIAAMRVVEIGQLVRRVRARATEFVADRGDSVLKEIEAAIARVQTTTGGRRALKSRMLEQAVA